MSKSSQGSCCSVTFILWPCGQRERKELQNRQPDMYHTYIREFLVLRVLIAMKLGIETMPKCQLSLVSLLARSQPLCLEFSMNQTTRLFHTVVRPHPDMKTTKQKRYTNIKFKSYHKLDAATVSFSGILKINRRFQNMKRFELCINNKQFNKQSKQSIFHIYKILYIPYEYKHLQVGEPRISFIVFGFRRNAAIQLQCISCSTDNKSNIAKYSIYTVGIIKVFIEIGDSKTKHINSNCYKFRNLSCHEICYTSGDKRRKYYIEMQQSIGVQLFLLQYIVAFVDYSTIKSIKEVTFKVLQQLQFINESCY